MIPPQKIKVYKVTTKTVPIYEEFVGQVFGEKDIPIRARVEGFLDEIHFLEGSNIEKGKLILKSNQILINGNSISKDSLKPLLTQNKNKYFLGFPLSASLYESSRKNPDSIFNKFI